jgi:hypothetical protein
MVRRAVGHSRPPVARAAGLPALHATAGNQAVTGLISSLGTVGLPTSNQALMRLLAAPLQRDPAAVTKTPQPGGGDLRAAVEKALVETATMFGLANEDQATDQVFWLEHPDLHGQKLQAGTPLAGEWLRLRNGLVRPAIQDLRTQLADAAKTSPKPAAEQPKPAESSNPHTTTTDRPAAKAGLGDTYLTQNYNTYKDDQNSAWKAASGTCNVTSLSMGLVSLMGSEQALREKLADLLRREGMPAGATCKVGGVYVPIADVIADPKLLAKARVQDLAAAAVLVQNLSRKGEHLNDLLSHALLMQIATKLGLKAESHGKGWHGTDSLADAKLRAKVKEMLDQGTRVVGGTHNHVVYLVDARDDGVVMHDPAGARLSLDAPWFLNSGEASPRWIAALFDARRRETALRRASTNPELQPVMQRLVEIAAMDKGPARTQATAGLGKEFPGFIAMGANNFYNLADIVELKATISFTLSARAG